MTEHQMTITPEALSALGAVQPLIQVIHSRDPDSECGITVYINGVRQHKVEVEDIDPGRGYNKEDYEERRADAYDAAVKSTATEYDRDVLEALADARFERFGFE